MRTRREVIALAILAALLAAHPTDSALARGGEKQEGKGADAKPDGKKGDDAKDKDKKKPDKKVEKPKPVKLDPKFKEALKAAKTHLTKGEDGVEKLLAGLGDQDKLVLDLNVGTPHNFSKKQSTSKLEDWLKRNKLTIGKRRSVVNEKSASYHLELRNPQKREGTLQLSFAKSKDGKSYRLRGIVIQAK